MNTVREVDNDYWLKFQDGARVVFQPGNGWCAEIREGSMGYGNTIAEAIQNLRARWEERNVAPEQSANSKKIAALEAANRELVEALDECLEELERFSPLRYSEARAILAKHKATK